MTLAAFALHVDAQFDLAQVLQRLAALGLVGVGVVVHGRLQNERIHDTVVQPSEVGKVSATTMNDDDRVRSDIPPQHLAGSVFAKDAGASADGILNVPSSDAGISRAVVQHGHLGLDKIVDQDVSGEEVHGRESDELGFSGDRDTHLAVESDGGDGVQGVEKPVLLPMLATTSFVTGSRVHRCLQCLELKAGSWIMLPVLSIGQVVGEWWRMFLPCYTAWFGYMLTTTGKDLLM